MSNFNINAGIQLVPLTGEVEGFSIIDDCIAVIKNSGLPFSVNAMETVVEASFEEVQKLIVQIQHRLMKHNELDYLLNVRYHVSNRKHVSAQAKTAKHN